jgi:hypothetical protein
VELNTPGGAPRYENKRCRGNNSHVRALYAQGAIYKHCVRRGQAECGPNAALHAQRILKHAFEIETMGKTAIVNQR